MAWASLLLGSLASSSPPARLINLPRHTTRLEEVKRQLDNANLRFERVQAQAPRSPQCPHPRRSFHIHICQGWSRRCFHGVSSGRGRLDHAASLSPKNELTNSHSLSPHLSLPPTHALSLSPFYVYICIYPPGSRWARSEPFRPQVQRDEMGTRPAHTGYTHTPPLTPTPTPTPNPTPNPTPTPTPNPTPTPTPTPTLTPPYPHPTPTLTPPHPHPSPTLPPPYPHPTPHPTPHPS